ncbi:hypothetical protein PSEUBRA_004756 [Kalmanozyma brasiliensis GHG001]|uniref:uncharacterized protein n=1 Tax=Kalmanozyma brasiliensis (strain GHG001) TaxID=1365824 RepID=UPI002868232A|nr:uncharacterized protein PSEUBRA_004756 [Kalmanozyma brasiliensis GHG001]KAF6767421.1 hypothetical protein PSEUBRA_004756 [Kalmanozyma brasiliensis GHG001]
MPKLKLLIIDLEGYSLNAPKEALSNLVDQGLLKDMSAQFVSKEAREGSSGLKYGYANEAASSSFIPSPEVSSGMSSTSGIRAEVEEALKQHNPSWLNSVRQKDDHWRLIHSGKSDLIRIWNANRSRRASDTAVVEPTEIRVTASKSIDRICDKDFVKDLHRRTNTTGESRPGEVSPNDPGVWADPDVFTLVEVKPWLPYFLFPRQGCCCWTGELPRDSNANQHQTDSQVETRRVVYPAFIILAGPDDEPHSKIEPDDKPQAKGKRKSERIQARTEQAAEKKRQRAESNAADQAGRSSRPRQQQTLLHFWAQGSPSPSKA